MKIILPTIFVALVIVVLWSLAEIRINGLEGRIHELECRHVYMADFKTFHENGEVVRACLGK